MLFGKLKLGIKKARTSQALRKIFKNRRWRGHCISIVRLEKLSKKPKQFKKWFYLENLFLDEIALVNSQRHGTAMNMPSFYPVRNFIAQVFE